MISKIKGLGLNIVRNSWDSFLRYRRSKVQSDYETSKLSGFLGNGDRLSRIEKETIKNKWGGLIGNVSRGYNYYLGLKRIDSFNPDYLSSAFYSYLEPVLNPQRCKPLLGHKGLTELIYQADIKHPVTVVRSIGGNLFDTDYKPLSKSEAALLIGNCGESLIMKPAVDYCQGEGIRKYDVSELEDLSKELSSGSLTREFHDFVIQKLIRQSKDTEIFNPSSLNCMRITTLNLNGRVSVGSRALKCGPQDSVVDNIGEGRRGVIVGISPDGMLNVHGYYGNGEVAEAHNNINFRGRFIKNFRKVEEAAIRLHQLSDECKLIGWDIALDEDEEPVLIEGNVKVPGIALEQMCSGPIFGDRTDEVIEWLRTQMKK